MWSHEVRRERKPVGVITSEFLTADAFRKNELVEDKTIVQTLHHVYTYKVFQKELYNFESL
jgi:hypothetical protein